MTVAAEKQVRKLLAPIPNLQGISEPQGTDLTEKQKAAVDTVIKHFSREDYELPGQTDGSGRLKDEEKFWLVRTALASG